MDPIAPLDYERWAVLVNPFPVPLPNAAEPELDISSVLPAVGSVPTRPLGYFSDGFDQGRYSQAGTGGKEDNAGRLPHPSVAISPLSSGTTDSIFRILLNERTQ